MADFYQDDDDYYHDDSECCDLIYDLDSDSEVLPVNATSPSCKVITKESLLAAQREDIRRVMEILSLKGYQARSLLIFLRWDVDRILQLFIENGQDKLYGEAGVVMADVCSDYDLSQSSSVFCCTICCNDVCSDEVTAMDCGHFFCNKCWTQHFTVKINEGQSRRIKCMKCNVVCDDEKIRYLVGGSDPNLAEKFNRHLYQSYIEDNNRVKWCPSVPHCGNAMQVEDDEPSDVECACGKQFCFSCLSDVHSPCSCMIWELWSKKCQDASENANWITFHTKPCPKCHKLVEKDGGCNLVSCVCGQPFCWLCGGATGWEHNSTSIANHSCGWYTEDEVKKTEQAKSDLYSYMHYYNRYKAHLESLKLKSELQQTIEEKISILEEKISNSKDFSWIRNGLHVLFRSRRILSVTYAFAYYMFGDDLLNSVMSETEKEIRKNLFETQQQQFEGNIEKLSLLLDEQFEQYEEDKILNLRLSIIAVSNSTENLCQNLYDCIQNDLLGSLKGTYHKIAPYKSTKILSY